MCRTQLYFLGLFAVGCLGQGNKGLGTEHKKVGDARNRRVGRMALSSSPKRVWLYLFLKSKAKQA